MKLVGICRHDVYPTLGTAITPAVWKNDLTLMKEANFNAVRTSHYPYGPGFYDLCDEMGFYVLDEEPFCWVDCDKPELMPAFEQRARETVEREVEHASESHGFAHEECYRIWREESRRADSPDPTR